MGSPVELKLTFEENSDNAVVKFELEILNPKDNKTELNIDCGNGLTDPTVEDLQETEARGNVKLEEVTHQDITEDDNDKDKIESNDVDLTTFLCPASQSGEVAYQGKTSESQIKDDNERNMVTDDPEKNKLLAKFLYAANQDNEDETDEGEWTCEKCDLKFQRKLFLTNHQLLSHRDEMPVKKCRICKEEFESAKFLERHLCVAVCPEAVALSKRKLRKHTQKKNTSQIDDTEESEVKVFILKDDNNTGFQDGDNKEKTNNKPRTRAKRKEYKQQEENVYTCEICGKQKYTNAKFKRHVQTHLAEKKFKCPECPKTFPDRAHMRRHILSHSSVPKNKCATCSKIFRKEIRYNEHIEKCGKEDVQKKKRVVLPPGVKAKCEKCLKEFPCASKLVRHMKHHNNERDFHCETCGKAFFQQSHVARHMKVHEEERAYSCQQCGKFFSKLVNLILHQRIHNSGNTHKCQICGKECTHSRELKAHICTHFGIETFPCELCSKIFTDPRPLEVHMREHRGEFPFKCAQCNKAFSSSSGLRSHKKTHSDVRHTCETCGKTFALNASLKLHQRLHTGENLYRCDFCSKPFTQPNHLRDHRRQHTGERPFLCKICNKSFMQNVTLRSHMKTHSDERPHGCHLCDSKFKRKNHLDKHLKWHAKPKKGLRIKSKRSTEDTDITENVGQNEGSNQHENKDIQTKECIENDANSQEINAEQSDNEEDLDDINDSIEAPFEVEGNETGLQNPVNFASFVASEEIQEAFHHLKSLSDSVFTGDHFDES